MPGPRPFEAVAAFVVMAFLVAVAGPAGTAHARAIAPVVDVTAESGSRLVGELAAWKTTRGGRNAETWRAAPRRTS